MRAVRRHTVPPAGRRRAEITPAAWPGIGRHDRSAEDCPIAQDTQHLPAVILPELHRDQRIVLELNLWARHESRASGGLFGGAAGHR